MAMEIDSPFHFPSFGAGAVTSVNSLFERKQPKISRPLSIEIKKEVSLPKRPSPTFDRTKLHSVPGTVCFEDGFSEECNFTCSANDLLGDVLTNIIKEPNVGAKIADSQIWLMNERHAYASDLPLNTPVKMLPMLPLRLLIRRPSCVLDTVKFAVFCFHKQLRWPLPRHHSAMIKSTTDGKSDMDTEEDGKEPDRRREQQWMILQAPDGQVQVIDLSYFRRCIATLFVQGDPTIQEMENEPPKHLLSPQDLKAKYQRKSCKEPFFGTTMVKQKYMQANCLYGHLLTDHFIDGKLIKASILPMYQLNFDKWDLSYSEFFVS